MFENRPIRWLNATPEQAGGLPNLIRTRASRKGLIDARDTVIMQSCHHLTLSV